MPSIVIPSRNNFQPPTRVGIDWTNPLTRGLVFCINYGESTLYPRDLVGGRAPVDISAPTSVVTAATPFGVARSSFWNNAGSVGSQYYPRDAQLEPAYATWGFYGHPDSSFQAGYARPFGKTYNNGASPYLSYDLEFNPGGAGVNTFNVNCYASGTWFAAGNHTFDATQPALFAGTYDGTTLRQWFNGVQYATGTHSGVLNYDTSSTGQLIVSGSSSASRVNSFQGHIYLIAIWNRALSAGEMVAWALNPYQILRPIQ